MGVAQPRGGKVLVTGAGGFIGRAFCAHLAKAGAPHVAAVRALAPEDAKRPAYVALGDFAAVDWHEVLGGVEAVVHLAGRAHRIGPDADAPTPYVVANVHVTRRLADAAARAGVRRIVFASTVKVYGEASEPGRPFRAGDPSAPQDAYARSKAEAENVLREIAAARGIELAGIVNRRSLLYVGNAVTAIEAALRAPAPRGDALPIADAETISTPELVVKLARALSVEPRLFALPPSFLRGAATIIGRRGDAARLLDSLEVDALRFRGLTGWAPPFTLDQGLLATAAWWHKHVR